MIDYFNMVKEFHIKYGHHISSEPQRHDTVPERVFYLRDKLIEEEFHEFEDAQTREEVADALADLLYVVFGTAVSYGIPIDEVFAEVHRSNMTKSMNKDEKSIPGKTLKGDSYEPPQIAAILERK